MLKAVLSCAVVALVAGQSMASIPASDNADNAAYTVPGNWANGSNGGFGWGQWVFNTFVPTTGSAGPFLGGAANTDLQDVKSPNHAWSSFANGAGSQAFAAYRRLQGDTFNTANLVNGQTVAIAVEHGDIQNGGFAGVGFGAPSFGVASPYSAGLSGTANFQALVGFFGGGTNYELRDAAGTVTTTIPFSNRGLLVEFTLLNTNTGDYTVRLTRIDTPSITQTISGRQVNGGIDAIGLYNYDTEFADVHFNNFSVIPAPGAAALLGLGGLLAARRRR